MSFLSKIFGGKKDIKSESSQQAIQQLRDVEQMLLKKQEFLEKKIEVEVQTAKKNVSTNKRAAIQALKRKKRYEKQLQQIDGTLSTIEMQREALEDASTNTAVLTTMKNASDALKSVHQHMDVDQLHDMMDDISDQQNVAKEISEAISSPVGSIYDIDEEELDRELEVLEQEKLDRELLGAGNTLHLPDVPSVIAEKSSVKAVEDEDWKKLLQWSH